MFLGKPILKKKKKMKRVRPNCTDVRDCAIITWREAGLGNG